MKSVLELIQRHEGLRLFPYKCTSGRTTIGYGRNLDDKGITVSEARRMLTDDVCEAIRQLETIDEFQTLDEVRRAALIDMAYNLGFNGLMRFKRMWAAIERGEYSSAAAEMLNSKWALQVGHRAQRLAMMMEVGQWPE